MTGELCALGVRISRKDAKLTKSDTEGMAITRQIFVFVSRAQINHGGFETIIPFGAAINVFVSVSVRAAWTTGLGFTPTCRQASLRPRPMEINREST
jgi:hypothetical protein